MELSQLGWVIVQAGGPGTRMKHQTWNKPKCLVSVAGQPMLYHLFDRFPQASFLVIGDYLFEQLEAFLRLNPPPVPVKLVRATTKGTLGGVADALAELPDDHTPFALVWSDLLVRSLPQGVAVPDDRPLLGLSNTFPCRWSVAADGRLVEESSNETGIAGFFAFPGRAALSGLPDRGEFVRWLSARPGLRHAAFFLDGTQEVGELPVFDRMGQEATWARFFNDVEIGADKVVKRPRKAEFAHLIATELEWYDAVGALGFDRIPTLYDHAPMTMARIHGQHAFDLTEAAPDRKRRILEDVFATLSRLHALGEAPVDETSVRQVYHDKTIERVSQVRDVLPLITAPEIVINGLRCRNPFSAAHAGLLEAACAGLTPARFTVQHGDPTFSNMLIDDADRCWLFDPRGSFGRVKLYGDPLYDWAKLYYSVAGAYDRFNRRRFLLKVEGGHADLDIAANGWSHLAPMFRDLLGAADLRKVEIIHALIWISLAGYVKDDLDSILGAFFNGLWWLERALDA